MASARRFLFAWRHAVASEEGPAEPTDRLVAMALSLYMNADGLGAWPSGATLAQRTGLALRTVRPSLDRLCEQGWLGRQARPGPSGTRHKRWGFEYRARLPKRLADAYANGAAVALFTGKDSRPLAQQGNGATDGRRMEQRLPTNTAVEYVRKPACRKEGSRAPSASTEASKAVQERRTARDDFVSAYEAEQKREAAS